MYSATASARSAVWASFAVSGLVLYGLVLDECRAAVTFLGPIPYLSAADSPFPVDGSNPSFYLDDFEDGQLNTPGIFQPLHHVFGTAFHGYVMGPSELTDSVDADDGVIDGFGTAGHSFRSGALFFTQSIPQLNNVAIEFEFDKTELTMLPNAFGFVWTDGPTGIDYFRPGLDLRMTIIDSQGNEVHSPFVKPSVNMDRNGTTSEDIFIGVIADSLIAKVRIAGVYYGDFETMPYLEIDHVQYGRLNVPEPPASGVLAVMLACLAVGASRRRVV